jgi:Pin2-interacting protein X1
MADNHPPDTLNQAWKNDKTRFGYRMLEKMGWKEDKGLGKDENGHTSHIKIKKREEGLGIGMEKTTDSAGYHGWNATATSYNEILMTLKEAYRPSSSSSKHDNEQGEKSKKKRNKEKKSNKSSSSTIISVGIK